MVEVELNLPPAEASITITSVTNDDLYRRSSQYRLWSFTALSLDDKRMKSHKAAREKSVACFVDAYTSIRSLDPEIFDKHPLELSQEALLELPTYEEVSRYLAFYCKSVVQICTFFKLPTQVKATAVGFFKRFYLTYSAMEWRPKNVIYTCVFLAAKSENNFMLITSFVKALKDTEPKDILDLEFLALQSLHFTLLIHHPYRPLYGFFLDFQAVLLHPQPLMYDVSVDTLGGLYDKAKEWLNEHALLSDVGFLFTPPQIALAAMYDTDKRITDRYLKKKFMDFSRNQEAASKDGSREESMKQTSEPSIAKESSTIEGDVDRTRLNKDSARQDYENIVRVIRKCIKITMQVSEASRVESTEIDKKCFFALNPKKLIEKKKNRLTGATEVSA